MANYGQSGQDYGGYHGDISGGNYGGGNPRDIGQNDILQRFFGRMPFGGMFNGAQAPSMPQFPFMFGIPPSQLTPSFMPQIAPPNMGNPMNVNDLYSMYGVGPNQPMPVVPNVPNMPPSPVATPSPVEQPQATVPIGVPYGGVVRRVR